MTKINRNYTIGGEWLYLKVYTGEKTANKILCNIIRKLNKKLQKKGIDQFFYIRYVDTSFHLRLRYHLTDLNRYSQVLSLVHETLNPLINSGIVKSIKVDVYNRELERYNYQQILLAEQIFTIDSQCMIEFLRLINSPGDLLLVSVKSMDQYLSAFGMDINEKIHFVKMYSNAFLDEFNIRNNSLYTRQLNDSYRLHRDSIYNVLKGDAISPSIDALFRKKNYALKYWVDSICEDNDTPRKTNVELYGLIGSFIHMSLNRLFTSNNRLNECIMYYFLTKSYHSILKLNEYDIRDK